MELEDRYLVLKKADIEAAFTPYELHIFQRMVACVGEYRASQGKPENSYVVINQDEPYFPAVLALMDREMKGTLLENKDIIAGNWTPSVHLEHPD